MLPQPWGLAAEFGSWGQFSSSSRSLRALSFEDLCQLASLQGIFLSWSRSCTYCLGSLSERCLLQRIGKPVKFFSLMGSFGARITWFQPSFSYDQSPTGRKNKDKKKKGGERGKRGGEEKSMFVQAAPAPSDCLPATEAKRFADLLRCAGTQLWRRVGTAAGAAGKGKEHKSMFPWPIQTPHL